MTSLTYLGTFDDSVQRFPWNIPTDEGYLEHSLARHVVLGDRLLLNDGYLAMHPTSQKALLSGTQSLLFNLVNDGFVRIMSVEDSITASIRKRAESGVATHRALVDSANWARLSKNLDEISRRQSREGYFHEWPRKDMTQGFLATIRRCHGRTPAQLGTPDVPAGMLDKVIDTLETDLRVDPSAARTKFEAAAVNVTANWNGIQNARQTIRQLMWLANEAYHTNFAACLAATSDTTAYGVETRHSQAFDELFETTEAVAARVRAFRPINWPRHPAFSDTDKLRQFVTPSPARDEKTAYLSTMNAFLSGDTAVDDRVHDAARQRYLRFIASHFGQEWEGSGTKFALSIYIFGAGTAAGAILTPGLELAAGGLLFAAEQFLSPMLIKKLSVRELENALSIGELIESDISLRDRLRRNDLLASVTLDKSKADELAGPIPSFG